VYQFFRRHVYSPMRSRGWSHFAASTTVFLLSAVLHVLLVGIPTHNIIGNSPVFPSLSNPPPPHTNTNTNKTQASPSSA
jgi:hypothetical protein